MTLDSHALVRNNTQQSPAHFAQFPPGVIFCKIVVTYCNRDIGIDRIWKSYFRFPQLYLHHLCVCVLSSVHFITCVSWHICHHSQDTQPFQLTPQGSLSLPFCNHNHLLLVLPPHASALPF